MGRILALSLVRRTAVAAAKPAQCDRTLRVGTRLGATQIATRHVGAMGMVASMVLGHMVDMVLRMALLHARSRWGLAGHPHS